MTFIEEKKESEEMKPNSLDYLSLVKDMNEILETDFCMDMDCKLNLHGGRDKNSFTQEEAQTMAKMLGQLYTMSHYWYCVCGLGSKYKIDTQNPNSKDNGDKSTIK